MGEHFKAYQPTNSTVQETIETGLVDLDKLLGGGLPKPALVIISGYSGVGKTDLALNIARHAAQKPGAKIGIISLDTPISATASRLQSSGSNRLAIPPDSIHLWFAPGIEIQSLCHQVKAQKTESGLDLLVVDRVEMIGQKTSLQTYAKRLKELSHEADITTIAVTSTITENRILSKNPLFATADVVIHLERADYRYSESEWQRLFPDRAYPRGIAEIKVPKNRYGHTGSLLTVYAEKSGGYMGLELNRVQP